VSQLTTHKNQWILLDSRLYLDNQRVHKAIAFNCLYVPQVSRVRIYLEFGQIDYWAPRIEWSNMYGIEVAPLTELRLYNKYTDALRAAQRV
jgi:hypothetical protein